MVGQRRSDTEPEIALRRELHHRGLRYRINMLLPLKGVRRRADVVFTGRKIAVFVDGCYLLARLPHPPNLAESEFGVVANQARGERAPRPRHR